MKAFLDSEKVKNTYLIRVKQHQEADEIVKGQYWQEGKGCAVGCTIHSNKHSEYETLIGVPEWLACLQDTIFEGLPNEKANLFPLQFLEAINVGANLEQIKIPMLIFIVESARSNTNNESDLKVIDNVLFELKKDVLDLVKLKAITNTSNAAHAADAAAHAAKAVTRKNEYVNFSEQLLKLISECK